MFRHHLRSHQDINNGVPQGFARNILRVKALDSFHNERFGPLPVVNHP
jgi:hypothetical protein